MTTTPTPTRTLTPGTSYEPAALMTHFAGWSEGDGSGHDGYHVSDYFRDGVYAGPDQHGIEPVFRLTYGPYLAIETKHGERHVRREFNSESEAHGYLRSLDPDWGKYGRTRLEYEFLRNLHGECNHFPHVSTCTDCRKQA